MGSYWTEAYKYYNVEREILWGRWMNPLKNKHWIGICKEAEEEEDWRKPGKGPFLRKQENATKHEARLRAWGVTESDGDA